MTLWSDESEVMTESLDRPVSEHRAFIELMELEDFIEGVLPIEQLDWLSWSFDEDMRLTMKK